MAARTIESFNIRVMDNASSPERTQTASPESIDVLASMEDSEDSENAGWNRVTGKRRMPEGGLSPRSTKNKKSHRLNNQDDMIGNPVSKPGETDSASKDTTNTIERPGSSMEPLDTGGRQNEHEKRMQRYSFIVKSNKDIDIVKLVLVIAKALPKESIIQEYRLSNSKKIAMFRTRNDAAKQANSDLIKLQRPEVNQFITSQYGDGSLKVWPYNQDRKVNSDPTSTHVIVKNVPTQYSNEDFLELVHSDEELKTKTKSCSRITSTKTGDPTELVRLICIDETTALYLIENGLKILSLRFKCEKSFPRIEIRRCYKCQEIGHLAHECVNDVRCPKCSDAHKSMECQKTQDQYKCLQCGENHAVWAGRCQTNIAFVQSVKQKITEPKITIPPKQTQTAHKMGSWAMAVNVGQGKPEESIIQNVDQMTKDFALEMNSIKDQITTKMTEVTNSIQQQISELNETIKKHNELLTQVIQRGSVVPTGENEKKTDIPNLESVKAKISAETNNIRRLVQSNMDYIDKSYKHYETEMNRMSETLNNTQKLAENLSQQQEVNNELYQSLPDKIHETCQDMVKSFRSRTRLPGLDRRDKSQTTLNQFKPAPTSE